MIKKTFNLIATCTCAVFIGLSTLVTPAVYADDVCNQSGVPDSVREAAGCPGTGAGNVKLEQTITNIINGVILVLGIVAVVFIIIGGINYMISLGDSNKVKKARDTILYAVIGLIICVLAYAIVNFVIINIIG